ncbi:hypothetical protein EIN_098560 [Entamoeba invadens IP1]|uniref:Coatomer subunit delta n=1 Tax=Entamoeba invadens IP1 TaxID=370355 RepID=A0A0A1U0V0_ENTIV|nr:hypothetical protein EIN_098560 [Entamoeba invadens IP1]ELP87529.1 hypothetical protein EIN_098560 [Entamoeba invadens IP1]|eukprot:XP_004254300.1 hypothetical protein EIN_098560 [Entamoeba invadens IP1]
MSRTRIEGLYATFTRMCGTTQNSCFEADGTRFLYRLCEDVYIVVITTLSSNVIEDTQIMNSVISSLQQKMTVTAKTVTQGMFEALFILDEYLQWGFTEKLATNTVRSNLAMKSRDEEIYLQQLEAKKAEAARIAKQREEEIREEKMIKEKIAMMQNLQNVQVNEQYEVKKDYVPDAVPSKKAAPLKKKQPKAYKSNKGLQLGKKKQSDQILEEIRKDEPEVSFADQHDDDDVDITNDQQDQKENVEEKDTEDIPQPDNTPSTTTKQEKGQDELPKFCPECGAKNSGTKFCPECGFKF